MSYCIHALFTLEQVSLTNEYDEIMLDYGERVDNFGEFNFKWMITDKIAEALYRKKREQ